MLDPRRLRLLIALESLGTVRAVAEAASMSPSAVSQQLQTLEQESGAALLERHGRAVALTDAGVALAAHARAILERIGAAEEDLRALRDAPAGTVRIASFTSAMRAFVIEAAATVGRTHPGISVHLSELEPDDCVPALARGEVDLAVVADFGDGTLPHAPHVRRIALAQDELMAVLPPGHPFASGKLEDLRDDPWLLDGTELERHVVARCRRAGFEPRVTGPPVQPRGAALRRPLRARRDRPAHVRARPRRRRRGPRAAPERAPRARRPAPRGSARPPVGRAHARPAGRRRPPQV